MIHFFHFNPKFFETTETDFADPGGVWKKYLEKFRLPEEKIERVEHVAKIAKAAKRTKKTRLEQQDYTPELQRTIQDFIGNSDELAGIAARLAREKLGKAEVDALELDWMRLQLARKQLALSILLMEEEETCLLLLMLN